MIDHDHDLTVTEVLTRARQLIADKGWGQNSYAQSPDGTSTTYNDPEACNFCTVGAIYAVDDVGNHSAAKRLFREANDLMDSIPNWNDDPDRTREEVLAAFDKAIAYSQST